MYFCQTLCNSKHIEITTILTVGIFFAFKDYGYQTELRMV